jgi:lipoyl-dependent peroxiredoxin subunit D
VTLQELKDQIPDYGRDIRLNLETVLTLEGAPGLSEAQLWGVALAGAYALGTKPLVSTILRESQGKLDDQTVEAARAAATIMAMNNVYYRAQHMLEDPELKKLPTRLRMNVIGKPGIAKLDFELMSFAVSALAGCGQCMSAHLNEVRKAGLSHEGAQSALRIVSVLNAARAALAIND